MHGVCGFTKRTSDAHLRGRMILVPIEARLAQLKAQLVPLGVGLPESPVMPGTPNISEIERLVSAGSGTFGFVKGVPRPARTLLWALAEEIGLTEPSSFVDATAGQPIGTPSHQLDETMTAFLDWADKARRHGIRIPERPGAPGKPNIKALALAASVDPKRLSSLKQPFRHLIAELADELGFMSTETFGHATGVDVRSCRARAAADDRARLLRKYLSQHHVVPGRALPESSRAHGRPAYGKICQSAGVYWRGKAQEPEIELIIDEAARIVGIGADGYRPGPLKSVPTFGEIFEIGTRRFELEKGSISKGGIARFRWAYRTWLTAIGKMESDLAEESLGDLVDTSVMKHADAIRNSDTRRHWIGAMDRWRRYMLDFCAHPQEDLPPSFGGALRALIRKAGYPSLRKLVRTAGIEQHYGAIHAWLHAGREPLLTERAIVSDLERVLEVPDGTLWARIRRHLSPALGNMRVAYWPSCLKKELQRKWAKPLLPADFAYRSEIEREQVGQIILAEIEGSIEYRRRMRASNPWRLSPLPDGLHGEIKDLIEYKTAAAAPFPRDRKWRPGSVKRSINSLTELFSAMALPRNVGGLGIPAEDLSLGYLASIGVFAWFAGWMEQRYPDGFNTGARASLGLIAHLTTKNVTNKKRRRTGKKGYLHHRGELALNLKPIPGVLDENEISTLGTSEGWSASLHNVNGKVWEVFHDQEVGFRRDRDPFEPILPILARDRPLDVLVEMLAAAYRDLPEPIMASPLKRAIAVRRFVAVLLEIRTLLRRRNVAELTWREDNRGRLRRDEDHWILVIPANEFKNSNGPFFTGSDEPYVCHLPASDTKIIDEYVNVSRRVLLKGGSSDALFINRHGEKLYEERLYDELAMMTWQYLVHHETTGTGIPGVERFGPHAIRDIGATHILKTTGDINLAADALQDSPEMVIKHYARYLPGDRTRRVTNFFAADLVQGAWAR